MSAFGGKADIDRTSCTSSSDALGVEIKYVDRRPSSQRSVYDLMPLRAVRAFIYILNRALGPGSTALKRPLERDCKAHILFGVGSGVMLHRRFDPPLLPSGSGDKREGRYAAT